MPWPGSSAPSRTAQWRLVGSWLNSALPQVPQKSFAKPCSGCHVLTCSSPAVTRSAPGGIRACAEAAAPVRRWQRVQWQ